MFVASEELPDLFPRLAGGKFSLLPESPNALKKPNGRLRLPLSLAADTQCHAKGKQA